MQQRNKPTASWPSAHIDDIHTLLQLGSQHVVTGSKDNTIKLWKTLNDRNGTSLKSCGKLFGPNTQRRSNKKWITMMSIMESDRPLESLPRWVSGTRDGNITIWSANRQGRYRSEQSFSLYCSNKSHVCKNRNKNRILCSTSSLDDPNTFYVGLPTEIAEITIFDDQNRIVKHRICSNDWLYTMKYLAPSKILAAVGPTVQLIDMDDNFNITDILSEDSNKHASPHRRHSPRKKYFVSALSHPSDQLRLCYCACFDGTVKSLDIERASVLSVFDHSGYIGNRKGARLWSCSLLDDIGEIFVSSGDDGNVLVWDVRHSSNVPVIRLPERPGRVSQAVALSGAPQRRNSLMTSYCADDPIQSNGSHLEIWDLRIQ